MTRIAIAFGDANGIGPEIALKAACHFADRRRLTPVLVGDRHIAEHYRQLLAPERPLVDYGSAADLPGTIAISDAPALKAGAFAPGMLDARAGRATVAYVQAALGLAQSGRVDAIVGCPHSETAVNRAGIAFNGYAGLVAELTGTPRESSFMMLIAQGLRIAHVTLHESVATALARLTPELVIAAGRATLATAATLGIAAPRLGVVGINPHAGEDGLFGDEDERITRPAVAELRRLGHAVDGPVGADLMLSQRRHDFYLAMFHDQGHIPIKLLSPLRATALVLGTPVTFASVAHGCAHDIAGRGIADPTAILETLDLLAR